MRNINLLLCSLRDQMPTEFNPTIIDRDTHYTLSIENPDERFINHFQKYFENDTSEIKIKDGDSKKLIEMSLCLRRYYNY